MSFVADYIDYKGRHLLIQWLINIDRLGFRKLAHNMPHWLIPKPSKPIHLRLPNELLIYIDPVKDKGVEHSLYYTGTYEMGTIQVILDHLPVEGTFVDVGANIGLMSLNAALKGGEKGKVIAFEPHDETREILQHNIDINNFENLISVRNEAVGSEVSTKTIYDNWEVNRGAASLIQSDENQEGQEVLVTTLNKVFGAEPIDVMKVDVEGYELEVLKGADQILKRDKPPVLIVECTEETEHQGLTRKDLFRYIREIQPKYKCYKLKGTKLRRSPLVEILDESQLPTHDNLICIPG